MELTAQQVAVIKSWPYSERLNYSADEPVRWRFVNTSDARTRCTCTARFTAWTVLATAKAIAFAARTARDRRDPQRGSRSDLHDVLDSARRALDNSLPPTLACTSGNHRDERVA
jgi:hypothetical protein